MERERRLRDGGRGGAGMRGNKSAEPHPSFPDIHKQPVRCGPQKRGHIQQSRTFLHFGTKPLRGKLKSCNRPSKEDGPHPEMNATLITDLVIHRHPIG